MKSKEEIAIEYADTFRFKTNDLGWHRDIVEHFTKGFEKCEEQNKALLEEIERLKEHNVILSSECIKCQNDLADINKENLKLQSELKASEWISVEDRLPINYEGDAWNEVLTINELGKQQVLYYDKEYNRFTTKPHEPKITHWKWLNEPNKPKTN